MERNFHINSSGRLWNADENGFKGKGWVKEITVAGDNAPDLVGEQKNILIVPEAADVFTSKLKGIDLILCSHPEQLPAALRAKHVFPEHVGPVQVRVGAMWVKEERGESHVPALFVEPVSEAAVAAMPVRAAA